MIRLQAEDALFSGATIASQNSGAEGTYVDFKNKTEDFIEWSVEVAETGNYDLSFRYANGAANRPLSLAVNGTTQLASLDFSGTGGWSDWGIVTQSTALAAGLNTIRIAATGRSGGNFDWLEVSDLLPPPPADVFISDAIAIEGTDAYLVFDVTLSTVSSESIVLDLAAVDITAKGGLVSDFGIDPSGDPVDYANQELEVSTDGGSTWEAALNGTQVTFSPNKTALKVRLAVNDETAAEPAETMSLQVANVIAGNVNSFSDTGTGSIEDDDTTFPIGVAISNASAVEGVDGFAVFDITLSAASTESITLSLAAVDGTAKGGLTSDFGIDPEGDPVDYASQEFEVSTDGGSTWEAAVSGRQVTFAANQRALKVRLAVNDDSLEEATETFSLQVAGVVVGTVDDTTDIGRAAITDDDTVVVGSATYQAEEAVLSGPAIKTGKGSTGSGYADYANASGDFIEWIVNVDTAGTYDLDWRYAVGGRDASRPLALSINSVTTVPSLDFANTGGWRRWGFANQSVDLAAGTNTIRLTAIGSSGGNFDYLQVTDPSVSGDDCSPISLLPCTDIRLEGDFTFDFDSAEVGLSDKDGEGLGFTMVDPSSNPSNPAPLAGVVGYLPDNLDVDNGKLKITTTSGIQIKETNSLDNALGVGLNVPSKRVQMETTLVDLPAAPGGFAQAGLWFGRANGGGAGSSEDNYIKIAILSESPGNYVLETLLEENGKIIQSKKIDIPDAITTLDLGIDIDPFTQTVTTQYNLGEGLDTVSTFTSLPLDWFSFDQAGLDPQIATRSFGGVFATDRKASSPQVFSFEDFSITEDTVPEPDTLFDRWSVPVNNPTAMSVGPDGRLYVATLFGTIHAFTIDSNTRTFTSEVITTIPDGEGGARLTLGIAVDPDSTPEDVKLWVSHSDGSVNDGALNSGKISVLSGPGFTQKEDVLTGLPRAIANHATNNIDFGPDGKLYIWQGGNTGAGAANLEPTEFGDRPEQFFAAAALVADIPQWKLDSANFNGDVASPLGEFIDEFYDRKALELGRPFTELQVYASGLRNTYDGVFHSNGSLYAPGNGLGVVGTTVPVPRLGDPSDRTVTTQLGEVPVDNPGAQSDPLNRIVEGGYYGHPNPYRDEVVFKDGSFQGLNTADIPGHPDYTPPILALGLNKSANGIIEYTADNFFGQLNGDLLITNYSQGDDITRVELSPDGLSVQDAASPLIVGFENPAVSESFVGGFTDPLPIAMGPNGSVFVGEFNGGKISILESIGTWRKDLPAVPAPAAILDAGSATLDGKLYMIGGKTAAEHLSSVYVYEPGDPIDPTDDVWTTAATLPGVAVENPSVVSFDGQVYAFGGSTGPFSGAVSSAAVFSPDTNSWSALADMPTARGGATTQVINGEIYVIGGLGAAGESLNTVEVFDPVTGVWSNGPALQIARDNPGSAVVDDLLYVFGGRTRGVDDTLTSLEVYNPATGVWSNGNNMLTGRRTMSVGTLNGKIQVTGGEGGGQTFAAHEEYNPATGVWKPLSSIPTARHGTAFGTIDDVNYAIAGGPTAGSSFTNAVEAFTF